MGTWAATFTRALKDHGVTFCSYVPDNRLDPILQAMTEDAAFRLVSVTREEEGIGVSAGAALTGTGAAVMMQTTGMGNCINAIGSLGIAQRIPLLLVVTERGQLGEQVSTQVPLGQALRRIFEAIGVPHYTISRESEIDSVLGGAAQARPDSVGAGRRDPSADVSH